MSMIDLQREGYLPSSGVPQLPVTSGLEFYLDASVAASVDTANQKWKNLVAAPASGAAQTAYDFNMGANTTAGDADEPLHVGTAGGGHSFAYWNLGGDDHFEIPSNTTFLNSMHKNGANFTVIFVMTFAQHGDNQRPFATTDNNANPGIVIEDDNGFEFAVLNGNVTFLSKKTDKSVTFGQSDFYGMSIDENGGNVSFFYIGGDYAQVGSSDTFDAEYSSPSSNNSGQLGQISETARPLGIGNKMSAFIAYNRALSKAEMDQIYNHFKNQGRV